jgi:hypothetical protein
MNLKEQTQKNVKRVLEDKYIDFPSLLTAIRKSYGVSRRLVCANMGISYIRMFMLEQGYFAKELRKNEKEALCSYYGIEPSLLNEKMMHYLASGEGLKKRREYEARHPSKPPKKKRKK